MPRKNTSPVWDHFDVADENFAKCKHCGKNVSRSGGTTNVRHHLKSKHFAIFYGLGKDGGSEAPEHSEDNPGDTSISTAAEGSGPRGPLSPTLSTSVASASSTQASTPASTPPASPLPFQSPKSRFQQQSMDKFKTPDAKSQEKLHMAVAYYVATCNRPYNTVTKKGFITMLQAFKPGYVPVGRKALTETYVPKLYTATKNVIKAAFAEAEYVGLTTDTWTSGAGESYIALTGHFINSLRKLLSFTLSCRVIDMDHSGQNIKDWILEELKEWAIPKTKLSAGTTDNAENIRLCMDLLNIAHVRCYGHTLQNGVTQAQQNDEIKKLQKRINALLHYFSSDKVWRSFVALVLKQYKKTPRKLRYPSKTRWWSELPLYDVVIKEEKFHRAFLATHDNGKHLHLLLEAEEMKLLKRFKTTLDPLEEITSAMSGECYVTASAVLPFVYLTENLLANAQNENESFVESENDMDAESQDPEGEDLDETSRPEKINPDPEVMRYVVEKLQKRYNPPRSADNGRDINLREVDYRNGVKSHAFLVKCSFLDPSYKDDITENDKTSARSQLLQELLNDDDDESANLTETGATASQESDGGKRKSKGLGAIFAKFSRSASASQTNPLSRTTELTREQKLNEELRKYEHQPPVSKDDDVLVWWRDHMTVFPNLSKLAKRYLCVTATSTPSERVFSSGGAVVTDERVCLTGEHAEQLVFLSMNHEYVPKPK